MAAHTLAAALVRPARSQWPPTVAGGGLADVAPAPATAAPALLLRLDVLLLKKPEKKRLLPLQLLRTAEGS